MPIVLPGLFTIFMGVLVLVVPVLVNKKLQAATVDSKTAETAQTLTNAANVAVKLAMEQLTAERVEQAREVALLRQDLDNEIKAAAALQKKQDKQAEKMKALEKLYATLKRQHENLSRKFEELRNVEWKTRIERDAYRKELLERKITLPNIVFPPPS